MPYDKARIRVSYLIASSYCHCFKISHSLVLRGKQGYFSLVADAEIL
jgi:predicted nucleic acid-binding Zn finger protein